MGVLWCDWLMGDCGVGCWWVGCHNTTQEVSGCHKVAFARRFIEMGSIGLLGQSLRATSNFSGRQTGVASKQPVGRQQLCTQRMHHNLNTISIQSQYNLSACSNRILINSSAHHNYNIFSTQPQHNLINVQRTAHPTAISTFNAISTQSGAVVYNLSAHSNTISMCNKAN